MRWLKVRIARGCSGAALSLALFLLGAGPLHAPPERITVYAAASMTDVISAAAEVYSVKTGTEVRQVYAASSVLARQVAAGAPADLVISANTEWMDYLERQNLLAPGTRRNIAGNRLVVVVPDASPITPERGAELGRRWIPGRVALGETSTVPAGLYAKEALAALGLIDALRDSLVLAGSVRVALAWVARGEVDAGIVYASDAASTERVRTVWTFPEASHSPIVYPAAALKGRRGAAAFLDFLTGEEGRHLFAAHGFLPLNGR